MNEYVIITDSSCDLPNSIVEEYNLYVEPLAVRVDDKEYKNYPDQRDITFEEFFKKVKEGAKVATSATNVYDYTSEMEPLLEAGKDILILSFDSAISNTYNASRMATEEMQEKYPDRKIICIDTLCAALGQGIIVYLAAQMKKEGKTIEEVAEFVEANKLRITTWVTVDDLGYLKRGGRISATSEMIGSMLKIKPIIVLNDEGKLISHSKLRGRKLALKFIADKLVEDLKNSDRKIFAIGHAECLDEAKEVEKMVREQFPDEELECIIEYVGPVIGAHIGPGALVGFAFGQKREGNQ
ncbi:MAG: DegV family protein [Lachnospiraceae bacterium]|nr:DegV family protein [Lachnospiraceae bacterium]